MAFATNGLTRIDCAREEPLLCIHRACRSMFYKGGEGGSSTIRLYLWHGATALNKLSEVSAKSGGLPRRLMLMKTEPETVSFHQGNKTMVEPDAQDTKADRCELTSLCLPSGGFVAGSSASGSGIEADSNVASASDFPE